MEIGCHVKVREICGRIKARTYHELLKGFTADENPINDGLLATKAPAALPRHIILQQCCRSVEGQHGESIASEILLQKMLLMPILQR